MLNKSKIAHFLSHLCGEEVLLAHAAEDKKFLSHLCGEEVDATAWLELLIFLSHLCGEEGVRD